MPQSANVFASRSRRVTRSAGESRVIGERVAMVSTSRRRVLTPSAVSTRSFTRRLARST
jgi:hypothetical protein